jgi:hypothetical protein
MPLHRNDGAEGRQADSKGIAQTPAAEFDFAERRCAIC